MSRANWEEQAYLSARTQLLSGQIRAPIHPEFIFATAITTTGSLSESLPFRNDFDRYHVRIHHYQALVV